MDKLLIVAKREYMERLRSRWFIVMTLLGPALFTAALMLPVWMAARAAASANVRNVIVLDVTGTQLGERVVANLMSDSSVAAKSSAAPSLRRVTPDSLAGAA